MEKIEAPNINDSFKEVSNWTNDERISSHRVIKILTNLNEAWVNYNKLSTEQAYLQGELASSYVEGIDYQGGA